MPEKRIQLILNAIAYTGIFGFAIWYTVIWWQNPELTQMQLFQKYGYGLLIAILPALPAIIYDVYRKRDK
jgi:hypothetical protein